MTFCKFITLENEGKLQRELPLTIFNSIRNEIRRVTEKNVRQKIEIEKNRNGNE